MKRRLCESLEAKLVQTQSSINIDNIMQVWNSRSYGQLSVLLANLRALSILHHQHHWVTSGQTSYEDHLLYQRLYEAIDGEVDSVGERCVGLGSADNVNLILQMKTMFAFIKEYSSGATVMPGLGGNGNELIQKSLSAELMFLTLANTVKESLEAAGLLTRGLDNLLAGIEDVHETHVYLLKQRLG
jgi:hypothetical protein